MPPEPAPRSVSDYHPLEVISGFPRGSVAGEALEVPSHGPSPGGALRAAVLPALCRPPCVVAFSGGRDSSAVLAVATTVAREEGLPDPVPVSLRFPRSAASQESDWQRLVVEHLQLKEWSRPELTHELDIVGPLATRILRRHGLLYPVNAHLVSVVMQDAQGGALLTGVGGDEVLLPARYRRVNAVLARQVRPRPRDALALAMAYGPATLRTRVIQRRESYRLPWLRPDAQLALEEWRARTIAAEEVRWDRWLVDTWWRSRSRRLAEDSVRRLAADVDVLPVHPLQAPDVLVALARARGAAGFPSRRAAMHSLFGSLLPDQVLERRDKAVFNDVFWHRHAEQAAEEWDAAGLFPELVEPEALRRTWRTSPVDARSQWLLQVLRLRGLPSGE